ncbi:MAG: hypothetical protein CVV24_13400 [Ignavibacteriae bacterium HGW-Ignavibacteriae-3]|nr:MAG: hypothetical protein CVV24_13400 [Ignavibacteriae bacterium HGW-Ignavibacteriae-3]
MSKIFLENMELPFCKGCGHSLIANNIDLALQKNNYSLLDVIIVTDIGCHGIVDKCFRTHTFHGLHGRSVALASGVSAGLSNPEKKIIALIGDGGATIGMQHIIDAAHNNFDMTVIVHNNMLYGMTGGQPSEFTPPGFNTTINDQSPKHKVYDVCQIASSAGASFVSRVIASNDFSDLLATAFSRKGFSLVEVMEICPSYGVKANPGMKLKNVVADAGLELKTFTDNNSESFETVYKKDTASLIDNQKEIQAVYKSSITRPVKMVISGSAGEGVQTSAELFARAAIASGLNVTKKGNYPVTVGVGFSSSDIIISPDEIFYTGTSDVDVIIVTSQEGLDYSSSSIKNLKGGTIICDSSLSLPETSSKIIKHDFRNKISGKGASLYSLFYYVNYSKIFPIEALIESFKGEKYSSKIDISKLLEF